MKILRTILLMIPLFFIVWYLYDRYGKKTQQKRILAQVDALKLKGEKGDKGERGLQGLDLTQGLQGGSGLTNWRFTEKNNSDGSKELVLEVLTNTGFVEFSSSKYES